MSRTTTVDVAANVRAEVARRQLRQIDVAEALGLNQRAVSRRLTGQVEFSATELHALAHLLDTSVDALLGNTPSTPAVSA